ncbi:Gfo/Idh/MocA family oxidoreductase [Tunturiibacter empetritectus]|uniref:Dehydrogenase n=1 Tax=Tunturiibacter lichenicola TaxID=2051959 RepID=A0A852VRC7_9BACT|nr:Gfo/Idh/MocA family oxidoreductase [Edaphobacter lichenicola]NYF91882.1 putative dehydrogenase [Edaphobacter lichenicola]
MTLVASSRRSFLRSAAVAGAVATAGFAQQSERRPNEENEVQLSQIHGPSEQKESTPGPFLPEDRRVGFAIVGLGRLSLNQILPAFGSSEYSKPVALVSGDRAKAAKIAAQYGINGSAIYGYANYEELAKNPEVKAIYIVLPNGMHEEYVVRGAKTGKHILCEKPMATSSKEAEHMITACKQAKVKLMIAYRQQYEPHNRALRQLVTEGKLGELRGFVSSNSQQEGDPAQWRLKRSLSGGGCLPDVGLYCLNAARFLSGEEPSEVMAQTWQPKDDLRFVEVEASCSFSLRFPSGYTATCTTSYDVHKSQFLRMEGTSAWAEMSPAFAYHGNKLKWSHLDGEHENEIAPQIEEKDQFALEMDHFAECILEGIEPKTPGEEGLRDHRVMEAIYESARTGKRVKL